MAKIIWLGNELILMMDSNIFHRHGTTIGGVSIEGKDDDDNACQQLYSGWCVTQYSCIWIFVAP